VDRLRNFVGLLRSPDSGLLWLSVRFALAGGFGMVVYVLVTTLAADVAGLPFQAALAVGFYTALCINFMSQRRFVWARAERYHLPIHRQAGRYLLTAWAQYGVTVAATLLLPGALGIPTEAVYLAMIVLLSLSNFVILRYGIFHATPSSSERGAVPAAEEPERSRVSNVNCGDVSDCLLAARRCD
jgi:putative flippase GtrA